MHLTGNFVYAAMVRTPDKIRQSCGPADLIQRRAVNWTINDLAPNRHPMSATQSLWQNLVTEPAKIAGYGRCCWMNMSIMIFKRFEVVETKRKLDKEMATTTWAFKNDPPRDPKSDGKSETPSPATSSSIGVWYPAQEDILVVRANGAVPSDRDATFGWQWGKKIVRFLVLIQ